MANCEGELSAESKKVLTECFKSYDKSGDGVLEKDELCNALAFAGIFATREQEEKLAEHFDKNNDGKLQISELVDNWQTLAQHSVNGEDLLTAFQKFDTNGDGFIRYPELKVVLTKTGDKWSLQEAENVLEKLRKFDKDGDGKFSYSEFVSMYTGNMYPFKKPQNVDKDITQDFEMVTQEETKPSEQSS